MPSPWDPSIFTVYPERWLGLFYICYAMDGFRAETEATDCYSIRLDSSDGMWDDVDTERIHCGIFLLFPGLPIFIQIT